MSRTEALTTVQCPACGRQEHVLPGSDVWCPRDKVWMVSAEEGEPDVDR